MLSICNYGHYWSRELIDWGTKGKGNAGTLKATHKPGQKGAIADFRDQIAIYVLFDENRDVVYIGQTGSGNQRLFSRLRQHSRGQFRDRWENFSWFGFLEPSPGGILRVPEKNSSGEENENNILSKEVSGSFSEALDEIEAVLMQIVEPILNKQGPKWKGAKEYFQFDPVGPEPSRKAILERIDELERKIGDCLEGASVSPPDG